MGVRQTYARQVFQLQLVRPDHEAAILAFEEANRAYFATSISDRGDSYFASFSEQHRELLAQQENGTAAFFVLADESGEVLGRFNLYEISAGTARVGYRVAERAAGHGTATSGLRQLCQKARDTLGLLTLTGATSNENVASQRVLRKAGFAYVGATVVGGREGALFNLDLVVP